MKFKKHLKSLTGVLPILFVFNLQSCGLLRIAKVQVNNQEWCADKGPLGATCVNTLHAGKRDIPKDVWDKIEIGPDHRFGKLCTSGDTFADVKKIILKLCKVTRRCTYNDKLKVVSFVEKIEELQDEVVAVRNEFHFFEEMKHE